MQLPKPRSRIEKLLMKVLGYPDIVIDRGVFSRIEIYLLYMIENGIPGAKSGYFYNGKFYKDAAHTEEIEGIENGFYIDAVTKKLYAWDGTNYVTIGGGSSSAEDITYDPSITPHTANSVAAAIADLYTRSLDIDGLEEKVSPDDADELVIYDNQGGNNKKITWAKVKAIFDIHGLTEKSSPVDADEIPIYDSASNSNKKIKISKIGGKLDIHALTEKDSLQDADEFVVYDNVTQTNKKSLWSKIKKVFTDLIDLKQNKVYYGNSEPSDPEDGDIWIDPNDDGNADAGIIGYSSTAEYPDGTVGKALQNQTGGSWQDIYPTISEDSRPFEENGTIWDADLIKYESESLKDYLDDISEFAELEKTGEAVGTEIKRLNDVKSNKSELLQDMMEQSKLSSGSIFTIDVINTEPSSSSFSGKKGQIYIGSTDVYFCVADNSWKKITLSDF